VHADHDLTGAKVVEGDLVEARHDAAVDFVYAVGGEGLHGEVISD
jgi:hypothetical protein